jgi:hypothetical protein
MALLITWPEDSFKASPELLLSIAFHNAAFHNAYVKLDATADGVMRMGCHLIVKSLSLPSELVADSSELAIPN